jgi:Holliday junction resolvase RusA-like endonuclease
MFHSFLLSGKVVPKARPRVTCRGTFMPQSYRNWKEETILELTRQKALLVGEFPCKGPVSVYVELIGKHSKRGDLDNLAGAILDSLVQSEVLVNDNLNNVDSLTAKLFFSKEPPRTLIQIYLKDLSLDKLA